MKAKTEAKTEKLWDIRMRSFAYALRAIKLYPVLQERQDGLDTRQAIYPLGDLHRHRISKRLSPENVADFIHKYGVA